MCSITSAVAATEEEQVSPHHLPCVYNKGTAVLQQKKGENAKAEIQLTLCLSRIKRAAFEPTGNVVITCRLRGGNFENRRSPSSAATTVLSRGIARAAVWVGLGTIPRSRVIG